MTYYVEVAKLNMRFVFQMHATIYLAHDFYNLRLFLQHNSSYNNIYIFTSVTFVAPPLDCSVHPEVLCSDFHSPAAHNIRTYC